MSSPINRNYGTCNSLPDRTSPIPVDNKGIAAKLGLVISEVGSSVTAKVNSAVVGSFALIKGGYRTIGS